MTTLFLISCFVIGAALGSFLNVVITRLPDPNQSIVRPRSRCDACGRAVASYDLVPIISYLILRGRCRFCHAKIGFFHPFIEALCAFMLLALGFRFGPSLQFIQHAVFFLLLLPIAWIDLRLWLIPLSLSLLLVGSGLVLGVLQGRYALYDRLIGAGAGFLFFAAVLVCSTYVLRRSGRLGPDQSAMGWGDPVLLAGIGAFLGYINLPTVVFLASVQGVIAAGILRLAGRRFSGDGDSGLPENALPFGPFLALAALQVAFFLPQSSHWLWESGTM